jgi:hypothetical protein
MQGLTSAQIVALAINALQASADITGTVPAGSIVHSRTAPINEAQLPMINVYCHAERGNSTGYCQAPIVRFTTDVAIEYYAIASTDAALEAALSFGDTILSVLFASTTILRSFEALETITTGRATETANRRVGCIRQVIGWKHTREWTA